MRWIIFVIVLAMLSISGCSGTGFDKSATLMPDEFWIAGDMNPNHNNDWRAGEVTMGLKWKLK